MHAFSNFFVLIFAVIVSATPLSVAAQTTSEKPNVKAAQAGNSDVIIIGASYAKDWPVQQLAGRPVINRGVGGQESHEVLARFERDVVAHRPSAVIIWGFINDIFRSTPEALPAKTAAIKRNFRQMVDLARNNGIIPIIATEVTMRSPSSLGNTMMGWIGKLLGKRSYSEQVNEQVWQTNKWLREYAAADGVLVLDLQPVVSERDGVRKKEFAKDDGSHITPAAYDALTAYADPELLRLLATSGKEKAKAQ